MHLIKKLLNYKKSCKSRDLCASDPRRNHVAPTHAPSKSSSDGEMCFLEKLVAIGSSYRISKLREILKS